MPVKQIGAKEIWEMEKGRTLFDVRTPAEYQKGHIPGAHNLPLFSNEERAEVGALYKQVNPYEAFLRGLELVGPNMRRYVEKAHCHNASGKVAVHCWRGGQRSSSMAWLLSLAGMDVAVLEGGYKAYRNYIHEELADREFPFLILGGETGAGKTEVLWALQRLGEQTVDLEGLAHHKGSAFGALGEFEQPSVEQFENNLFEALNELSLERRIWLENESRSIGRVYIPDVLWSQMCEAPLLSMQVPVEERVERLVNVYSDFSIEHLCESFEKIRKRLGGQHFKAAIEALHNNDYAKAARIALVYYDKAYNHHSLSKRAGASFYSIPSEESPEQTAKKLIAFAEENSL